MKTSNIQQGRAHPEAIIRGWVSPHRAGGSGVEIIGGDTDATGITTITVIGGTVTDNGDGTVVITIGSGGSGSGNTDVAVSVIAASGSSQTLDVSTYGIFDITLTANCTFTFTGAVAGVTQIEVILRQGGSGSYTVTWPSSVAWMDPSTGLSGGSVPTLFTAVGSQSNFNFVSLDAGVTWGGDMTNDAAAGGVSGFATPAIVLGTAAAAGAATTVIRSDATIVAFDTTLPAAITPGSAGAVGTAAAAARRDHDHPVAVADLAAALGGHMHVVGETHLSDGSTTTYTLDEAFEPGTVEAFNTTTLAYLTVTETAPDQATVSAAGSSGDKITFSYAGSLA